MTTSLQSRPRFDADAALGIARRHFAVGGTATPLPSERDQNFRIDGPDGSWVLKLANGADDRALLQMQNEVLLTLARRVPELDFPRPAESSGGAGEHIVAVDGPGGPTLARLLRWVPGTPLAATRPWSPALLEDVGELLGRVAAALTGFRHPRAGRDLQWDLGRAPEIVAERIGAVHDAGRRRLVERATARFADDVLAGLEGVRRSVIHNDGNDHNVLCGPVVDTGDGWRRRVTGLIDAGDVLECWTAAEAAVGMAYVMLGREDPLAAASSLVAGFHRRLPLQETEIAALTDLARMRLCLSVVNSAVQRPQDADNEYLSVSEEGAWRALEILDATPPALAEYRLRHACGLEPCPAGARLRAWLSSGAARPSPVLEALARDEPHVFDLGVGSTEMGGGAPGTFAADQLGERLFGILRRAGKPVGYGRYDEARCWYGGELFSAPGDDGPRRRTVHVGVDLFAEPGTPLRAPLAGRVAAAGWNRGRLDYGPTLILEHAPEGGPRFWTLYGHLDPGCLAELAPGDEVAAGQRIAAVGAPPDNGDWAPHLHLQLIADRLGHEGDFPGVVDPRLRRVFTSICPDPALLLGLDPRDLAPSGRDDDAIRAARSAHLGPSLSLSYRRPLHIVRGWRQYLYDADGQEYLDAVNNVPHVGHSHPAVVAAASAQNEVLNTNTRYLHANLGRYVERLASLMPEPLSVCFLVCSGSEANELALRMARAHTGRRHVVVLDGAYHGNTSALVDMSPYKHDGPGGGGAPDWVHVAAMPDPYRGRHRGAGAAIAEAYAVEVRDRCADAEAGGGVAAFFAEALLGCGGQIVPPEGYLASAFEHVRAAGGVCVADEVQIGLGRVGDHMWAFASQGAVPDIVTLGKPLGNGYPLAAVITTPPVAASFANGMEYFNTFGGNPVACAVGLAVLDVIEAEGLQGNAAVVGARLLEGLRRLPERHALVGDVRGLGLYLGIELVRDRESLEPAPLGASYVVNRLRERGILVSTDGPLHNVIKIKPPLCFTAADADRLVADLDRVLGEDLPAG